MAAGSIHLGLPSAHSHETFLIGWSEPHTFARFDVYLIIYAHRNEFEILVVLQLIEESAESAVERLSGERRPN